MSEPSRQINDRFPLLKLPYLPMKDVVKQMPIIEIYKLSLATKRSRAIVKLMRLKTDGFSVSLCNRLTRIRFLPDEEYNETHGFYDETDKIILRRRENIQETKYIVSDPINECLNMAKGLNQLFEWKSFAYSLHVNNKEPEELKQILSEILTLSYTEILFSGTSMAREGGYRLNGVIDRGVLEYLLNNVKLDAKLFMYARVPEDFNHEDAFKLRKICYSDCSWVAMEMLKSFRNLGSITYYNSLVTCRVCKK